MPLACFTLEINRMKHDSRSHMKTTLLFLILLTVTGTTVLHGQVQGSPGAPGNPNAVPPNNGQTSPPPTRTQPPNDGATPAPAPGNAAPNDGTVVPPSGGVNPPAGTVIPPSRAIPPGNETVAPNNGANNGMKGNSGNPGPNQFSAPRTNGFSAPGTNDFNEPGMPNTNGFYRGPRGGGYLGGPSGQVNQ
jgi:hypothetical protein